LRVPSAGQPLDERRIVREGKRLAHALLADAYFPSATYRAVLRENLARTLRSILRVSIR
jgi:hypothetical protein